jgi:tetratricopeptide (TPR) repeat protein
MRFLVVALVGAMTVPAQAADLRLESVSWLEGTWRAKVGKDATREETWGGAGGGAMLGTGREIRAGVMSEFEFLALRETESEGTWELSYDAYVGGEAPVRFVGQLADDGAVVFANGTHDFPTRISYRLGLDGRLFVEVGGRDGEGFAFQFTRISAQTTTMDRVPDLRDIWNWSDPKASEQSFRALLPRTEQDPAFRGEVETQVARALGLQGRFEEAHGELDRVEAGLNAAAPRPSIRYALERGRVLRSSGHPEEARPFFEAAWAQGTQAKHEGLAVDAAHMVALVATGDEALEWNLRALALAEGSSQHAANRWRASLHNNIGWTHHDAGRFDEALVAFEAAVPLRVEQGETGPRRVAEWAVGRALRSLERTSEALVIQERLQAEWATAGGSDGYVEEELAECLLALGRADEAKPWFSAAHATLSADPWMIENEGARLARLVTLGTSPTP